MKKQLILLLVASAAVENLDAAANRFYNWCINNRSRLGLLSGAALSSGATAYYWNNRNQQLIDEETSKLIWKIRNRLKVIPKKEVKTTYSETISGPDVHIPIVDPQTGQVDHWILPGGLIPLRPIQSIRKEDIEICGNEPAHNPESKLVPDLVYGCKCKDYPSCKCWGKIKKGIHIIPTYNVPTRNLPAYSSERHQ